LKLPSLPMSKQIWVVGSHGGAGGSVAEHSVGGAGRGGGEKGVRAVVGLSMRWTEHQRFSVAVATTETNRAIPHLERLNPAGFATDVRAVAATPMDN